MVKLPFADAEKSCMLCLTDFQFEGRTVMMTTDISFHMQFEVGKNQVRMAYVLNREELGKAMFVLKNALEEYKM